MKQEWMSENIYTHIYEAWLNEWKRAFFFDFRSIYMEWPSPSSPTETLSGLIQT